MIVLIDVVAVLFAVLLGTVVAPAFGLALLVCAMLGAIVGFVCCVGSSRGRSRRDNSGH